jgi:hypothetical protein
LAWNEAWMIRAAEMRSFIRFYIDLGASYHASLDPDKLPVTFDVGLTINKKESVVPVL